ncbi:MAG: RagB/SusD family nutrient uptake outer membrane protein [Mangrovibacterium sp.]
MKKLIFLAAILVAATSCKDFLEEDPKGQFMEDTYFNTVDDIERFMPSIFYYASDFYYDGCSFNMSLRGDDMTGVHMGSVLLERFNQPDDEQYVYKHWEECYTTIKQANSFLTNMEKVTGDETRLKNLTGVAYFFRGWGYFNLAKYYRQAPIVFQVGGNFDIKSSSQARLFEQCVADMEKAESMLPASWTGHRMEKEAPFALTAKAALAEMYLYMAGYPLKKGTTYYQKAADKAKEVINGAAALGRGFDTYDNMWNEENPENNLNKERLFSVYFTANSQMQSVTRCFYPAEYGAYGWIAAERTFFREFPEGPRKEATFWDYRETANGNVSWDDPGLATPSPLYRKRCVNPEDKGLAKYKLKGGKRSSLMMPLRYTLTATTYAEAIARATGTPDALAYELMDKIRDRAELPRYARGLNGEAFAKLVVQERGWELAAEWTRYPDLCRLEMVEEVFAKRASDEYNAGSGFGTPSHDYYYLPVPASELALNPNLSQVEE